MSGNFAIKGGGVGPLMANAILNFHFDYLKSSLSHMILAFKIKGDVISDHFLMLWFQKDSLDIVGFNTFRGGGSRRHK